MKTFYTNAKIFRNGRFEPGLIAVEGFRFTIGDETREVGPGDTLLKQNGVMHGCVCLEAGVLLDFFTPMRDEFV